MRGGSKSETITENIFREFYGNGAFEKRKSQSKIKIWSLLERETDSSVTGI